MKNCKDCLHCEICDAYDPRTTYATEHEAEKCVCFADHSEWAEVKHGKWDDSFDGITPVCSVCGRTHSCIRRAPDYCPNCGARMDGDKE